MILKKSIILGTTVWAILFIITGFLTLFQMNETMNKVTILGLKISTEFSKSELNTTFSLTYRCIVGILIINILMYAILFAFRKKQ